MLTARMTSIGALRVGKAVGVPATASLTLHCLAVPSELWSQHVWRANANDALRSPGCDCPCCEVFLDSAFQFRCHKAKWTRSAAVRHSAIASDQIEPVGECVVFASGRIFHVINKGRNWEFKF